MHNEEILGNEGCFHDYLFSPVLESLQAMIQDIFPELEGPERRPIENGVGNACIFRSPSGNVEIRAGLWDNGNVKLGLRVFPEGDYPKLSSLSKLKGEVDRHWELTPESSEGRACWRALLKLRAEEMGGIREMLLREDLKRLKEWIKEQCPNPSYVDDPVFDAVAESKKYERFEGALQLVPPWGYPAQRNDCFHEWAEEIDQLLSGGVSVALCAESPLEERLALALVAGQLYRNGGRTLGYLAKASIDAERYTQILDKAPGVVAAPARIFSMGINPYQLGQEMQNLLANLSAAGRAGIFCGQLAEHQRTFSGSQGTSCDPLCPAVCHLPEMPLDRLLSFAVFQACQKTNISSAAFLADVRGDTEKALSGLHPDNARRVVGPVAARVAALKARGKTSPVQTPFALSLERRSETLGGLSRRPRGKRSAALQKHFRDRLTHPELLPFLRSQLLGQDEALAEFCAKLGKKALTRPSHQPLRLASLGEPATGKSRSVELAAEFLEVPYVNIDVSSMPDQHMALTQLLGSGPGYVGSDQPGRLEKIARHFEGCVCEISDLDHASAQVQSTVGDLFLQLMEYGEAQSGKGYMFSCCSIILIFTLNLPDNKSEKLFDRMGFAQPRTREEARRDIRKDLKSLVSGAFWSRVQDPVIFPPLSAETRAEVVRRGLRDALLTGLDGFGATDAEVLVAGSVAQEVLAHGDAPGPGFGARALLEIARERATQALLAYIRSGGPLGSRTYELVVNESNELALVARQ